MNTHTELWLQKGTSAHPYYPNVGAGADARAKAFTPIKKRKWATKLKHDYPCFDLGLVTEAHTYFNHIVRSVQCVELVEFMPLRIQNKYKHLK